VTGRSRLDREWQPAYNLRVVARDMPRRGGPDQKSATATVRVVLTDINDSPPQFTQSRYSAVVPENSPSGTLIAQVSLCSQGHIFLKYILFIYQKYILHITCISFFRAKLIALSTINISVTILYTTKIFLFKIAFEIYGK
jgi:hypothetical protein